MLRIVLALFVVCSISSCEKEPDINPYFAEVYPQILDEIDIECTESEEEYYLYALINGQEFCQDTTKVGNFTFGVSNVFTTSSPTVSTGNVSSDARHGLRLLLGSGKINRNEHFQIYFPHFALERNEHEYLDSLYRQKNHGIVGAEDVVITADMDIAERALAESNGGYLKEFLVKFASKDIKDSSGGHGGISFALSSIFGDQENSSLTINELKRIEEADGTYYYMDISFECDLYHWPQYGYEGKWAEVREGRIIVKQKLL